MAGILSSVLYFQDGMLCTKLPLDENLEASVSRAESWRRARIQSGSQLAFPRTAFSSRGRPACAVAQAQRCRTVSAPNCLDADGSSLLASAEAASLGSVDPPQASPASTGAPSGGEGPAGSTQSSSAASSPEKPRASPASADGVEGQDDDGANSGAEADGDHGQHGSDDAHSAAGGDGVEGGAEADADQGQQGSDGAHSGGAEADGDHGQQGLDSGDFRAQFESVVDEIRSLKEKLKGDGLSGNEHTQLKVLVEKLSGLKRFIVPVGDVA